VLDEKRQKRNFLPSGDQCGLPQAIEVGVETRPPQPGIGIGRRPLPSEWTTQIVLRYCESGTRAENRISFPCGDQLRRRS
jgi:hypothetical protein